MKAVGQTTAMMEAGMFYNGGMTLGYFTPPAVKDGEKAKTFDFLSVFTNRPAQANTAEDQQREEELSRAFITPWHLFY